MSPQDLFGIASLLVLPGWAILILAPRGWTRLAQVPALVIPVALSALYAGVVLTHFAQAQGGFGSLTEVRALFASDWALLAGWVHYLAFDLMIGAFVAQRMDRAHIDRLTQAAILVVVFLFGPLGLLLAMLIEAGLRPVRTLPMTREA